MNILLCKLSAADSHFIMRVKKSWLKIFESAIVAVWMDGWLSTVIFAHERVYAFYMHIQYTAGVSK